jgi:hypothetical protein
MKNNTLYRNITLSTRVSAAQKAEYSKEAGSHNISISEWMLCIIEMNKNSYGSFGDPTPKEAKLERKIELLEKKAQKLLVQRDTADQYAADMQERSNKAVKDADASNYALKEALVAGEDIKRKLVIAENLIVKGKPKEEGRESNINTISIAVATIAAAILFGRKI